jgi:hypothetical protein
MLMNCPHATAERANARPICIGSLRLAVEGPPTEDAISTSHVEASGMTANGPAIVCMASAAGGGRFQSFLVGIAAVALAIVAAYGPAELLRERNVFIK